VVCAIATPISATLGVLSLMLGGHVAPASALAVWTTWWLGDLAGGLVVAPALVLWVVDPPRLARPYRPLIEAVLTAMLAVVVGVVALGPATRPVGAVALAFLAVLPLLWGALKGSERDTITAAVILSAFAVWGAVAGSGPFTQPTLNDSFLLLVTFMVAVALPSLALSSGMGARGRDLLASQTDHRLLVDAIRDYAIFMADPDGRITTWNNGAARIYGYASADVIGQPLSKLSPPDAPQDLAALRRQVAETGTAEVEGWRIRQDGSRFWAQILVSAIRDDRGRLIGLAKITRDVSEQRQAQAELEQTREQLLQAQKLEALGQLTGGVAHDFNNLLMVVGGQADLLSRKLSEPKQLRSLDAIKAAVAQGSSLTRQLLSFARRQTLAPEVIDLTGRLEGMREVLKSSLGEAIELALDLDAATWPIEADPHELELAILNLVVNARDAMPEGGQVRIQTRNVEAADGAGPGAFVEISIHDTGPGMTPEVMAKAFDPFFTTKPTGKGTGLGLSQVHGFALQSGGRVTAVSRPGEGCQVILRLPRTLRLPEAARPSSAQGLLAAGGAVLLVEDNPRVAEVTAEMLRRLGCRVVQAADAADALGRLERGERFDLLLSDIVMPGPVDGLTLAGRVRARDPTLPILLATGYTQATEGLPGVEILRKPFDLDVLATALAAALGRSRPTDAAPT
jgi:PAS domain S-box-containing protein